MSGFCYHYNSNLFVPIADFLYAPGNYPTVIGAETDLININISEQYLQGNGTCLTGYISVNFAGSAGLKYVRMYLGSTKVLEYGQTSNNTYVFRFNILKIDSSYTSFQYTVTPILISVYGNETVYSLDLSDSGNLRITGSSDGIGSVSFRVGKISFISPEV